MTPVQTWNPARSDVPDFIYIDLSAVDQSTKKIVGAKELPASTAPSRARQLVSYGDVLVSTVRPNLNGVAMVPKSLDGATASTGFTVLRSNGKIDPRYLFHWVQSPEFISDMVNKATGASYPAVSDRIVKDSLIPLPPLEEQRRIATILDETDSLMRRRRASQSKLDQLAQAQYREWFGSRDDILRVPLGALLLGLEGGRNLVADDAGAVTPFRVLKISAVTSGVFDPQESKPLPIDYIPPESHVVRSGDLLMSRANTSELVGAAAYVWDAPERLVLPDKIWRFVWKPGASVEPLYVLGYLRTPEARRALTRLSTGTSGSMKNISKAKLLTLQIPLPEEDEQLRYVQAIKELHAQYATLQGSCEQLTKLSSSLQHQAFTVGNFS